MFDLLKRLARVDALTGRVNRAALDDALSACVAAFERSGQPMCLLMIDMDDFKKVNDLHGHVVGDDRLHTVARAIRSCRRPSDGSARFGGDEFAVIVVQVEGADAVLYGAKREGRQRLAVGSAPRQPSQND